MDKERRKQPDWMVKGATILNVISWLLTISALLVIDIAAPNQSNMFTHLMGTAERVVWDEFFILLAYIILVLSLLSSFAAFTFHIMRKRRKTDKLRISIIIIGSINLIGFIFFMYRFGFQLF
jgi:hypothetical protein